MSNGVKRRVSSSGDENNMPESNVTFHRNKIQKTCDETSELIGKSDESDNESVYHSTIEQPSTSSQANDESDIEPESSESNDSDSSSTGDQSEAEETDDDALIPTRVA